MSERRERGRRWHVIIPVALGAASALLFALYPRGSSVYEVDGSATPPPAVNGTSCSPLTQEDVDNSVARAGRGTGVTPAEVAGRLQIRQLDDIGRFKVSYSHPHAYQATRVVQQTLTEVVSRSCGRTVTNTYLAVARSEEAVTEASAERDVLEETTRSAPRDAEVRARLDDAIERESAARAERERVLARAEDVQRLSESVKSKSILRVGESRHVGTGNDQRDRIAFVVIVALGTTLLAAVIRGLRRNVDEAPAVVEGA